MYREPFRTRSGPSVRALALVIAGVAMLAACAGGPKPVAQAPMAQQVEELPAPQMADLVPQAAGFLIGPNDKLKIEVFGVPDLQREILVDGSGRLSFPLIGNVEAAGLRPSELEDVIETRLAGAFVKNPQVTVNIEETRNLLVTVDGVVKNPGIYPAMGRMSLLRAVAVAGGTTEFSDIDDVIIQRKIGDKTYVGLYNLGAIRRGNYPDPVVYPSDIVIVGDSRQRRLFLDFLQLVPLLTTPLFILLDNSSN